MIEAPAPVVFVAKPRRYVHPTVELGLLYVPMLVLAIGYACFRVTSPGLAAFPLWKKALAATATATAGLSPIWATLVVYELYRWAWTQSRTYALDAGGRLRIEEGVWRRYSIERALGPGDRVEVVGRGVVVWTDGRPFLLEGLDGLDRGDLEAALGKVHGRPYQARTWSVPRRGASVYDRPPMDAREPASPEELELLSRRICDLGLKIEGSPLGPVVARFRRELRERAIAPRLEPVFYLSTEWGVMEETVAVAIPFYLADPRLVRLEAARSGLVEGRDEDDVLRYLRHEMGHVVNYAYRLFDGDEWTALFGPMSREYQEVYQPVPFSPEFVRHLPGNYPQKHPDEDWAETFAVWATPGLDWRGVYADAPVALRKLEYCERALAGVRDRAPLVATATCEEDVSEVTTTLAEHYAQEEEAEVAFPRALDVDLREVFAAAPAAPASPLASGSALLRASGPALLGAVFRATGVDPSVLAPAARHLTRRAQQLNLWYPRAEREAVLVQLAVLLTTLAANWTYTGRFCPAGDSTPRAGGAGRPA